MRATLVFLSVSCGLFAQEAVFIRGATIHPVSSSGISGNLLIRDGRIADAGPKVAPPKGAKIVDARGMHVYPGMIDSATSIGLAEIGSVRETNDTAELGDFNPQLRTLIAVNPESEHIAVARANGITSVVTIPGGGIFGGQSAMIHLDGWTWEEMAVAPSLSLFMRFPTTTPASGRGGGGRRGGATPYTETRRRYLDQLEEVRKFFEDTRRYQKAKAAGGPGFRTDRKFEAMLPVIEGKRPVTIFAVRERAIRDALEFAAREKIRPILAGVREPGQTLAEIKKRNIPVILGETLALPLQEDDPYDAAFTLPNEIHKAGILFAFGTFNSSAVRNLPYQAATAAAFGLPREEALRSVTVNPAKIWGLEDKIGSITEGKWADLIVTDGDPLETKTQIKQMWIAGKAVNLDNRHTRLYQKYMNRP